MKKTIAICYLIFLATTAFAGVNKPTNNELSTREIESRLYDVEHKVGIIDNNQLNYKIEKDLLKETYSNNYAAINIIITLILGVVGLLYYLGIRDINSIKEKYEKELNELNKIKSDFEHKTNELDKEKTKFDEGLSLIIKENQDQNKKIKFLELKDKVGNLFKEGKTSSALEFANAALDLKPDDVRMLNSKATMLTRLNQLEDAKIVYKKALDIEQEDTLTISNFVEFLYFIGEIEEAKKIIASHKNYFENKLDGMLINFLKLFELYHNKDKDKLLEEAKKLVAYKDLENTQKRLKDWDLDDASIYLYHQEDNDIKKMLQNILWYLNGKITGKQLLKRLKLPIPEKPENDE